MQLFVFQKYTIPMSLLAYVESSKEYKDTIIPATLMQLYFPCSLSPVFSIQFCTDVRAHK